MKSGRPKVLHEIAGRSMLAHVLTSVAGAKADGIAVVVGPGREDVRAEAAKLCAESGNFRAGATTWHRPRGSGRPRRDRAGA